MSEMVRVEDANQGSWNLQSPGDRLGKTGPLRLCAFAEAVFSVH